MAEKKVGTLIKEARTEAGLTQEKLADKAGLKLTAAMISECERGIADLTSAQLKKIAVVCGVTQSSLLNAPKNSKTAEKKTTAAQKTAEKKTTAAKKTAEKKTTAAKKTTSGSAGKKTTASSAKASSGTSASGKTSAKTSTAGKTAAKTSTSGSSSAASAMKVTADEKKMLEAYRDASAALRKTALKVLKGEYSDEKIDALENSGSSIVSDLGDGLGGVIGDVLSGILGGKS